VVDKATGLYAAQAISAALLRRSRSGVGEAISVNMLDVALNFFWPDGMMDNTAFEVEYRRPTAAKTYRLTKTSDGHIAMMVLTDDQWAAMHPALDLEPPGDRTYPDRLREARERLARMSTAAAIEALTKHDVPCAPVLSLEDVPSHPQIVANQALQVFDHPVLGRVRQPVPAPRLGGMAADSLRPAPRLGEHTAEILAECGYSKEELESILSHDAVGALET
jgi:crotonobetainyl-CoA:carnitine CoA-transferase CaiB-like acyl-CoA transferase